MELRDLIVTPLVLFLVYFGAYLIRPYCTDNINRRYFIPALTVRIIGALAVGFIYQFYYNGGDTYNFHTHGSRHIWEAFMDDPGKGVRLFLHADDQTGLYQYSSKIAFYNDPSSFAIVRIAAMADLFTFSTYSATAVLFTVFSFAGMWMFFLTFYNQYPRLHGWIAFASLFIPSVVFWGSGLLKDTITLGWLGIATFMSYQLFIRREFALYRVAVLLLAIYAMSAIKIYILLTFLPSMILWIFLKNLAKVQSFVLKLLLFPMVISTSVVLGYFALMRAGAENEKYSLEAMARTAQITAYDIRYWTGKDAGSGYTLGELDGTWGNMLSLAPQAVNVSLFRPYLWEVKNPLMLLSALESVALLLITVYVVFKTRSSFFKTIIDPTILFCFVFSITFAFAVGVSTFNFGTLTRYKIPLLPFYGIGLVLLANHEKSARKLSEFADTE